MTRRPSDLTASARVAPVEHAPERVRAPSPEPPDKRPRVVHLTAEYWPFARTGGLAEAVRGLATFQAAAGMTTTVLLPLYRTVLETRPPLEPVGDPFEVRVGPASEEARLWRLRGQAGPRVLFLEHAGFFDRPGIYAGHDGVDYPDNARRFAFLCLGALQALQQFEPDPPVLHAHDWHTALAPVYLRAVLGGDLYHDATAAVLTVHNAGFQGHFPVGTLAQVGLPAALYDWSGFEWYGRVNVLKGGLAFTDMATTVSPTHAHELRTEVGGFGMHQSFIALEDRLVGILNGIDLDQWNPATDPDIAARYSRDALSGKRLCKAALQRACGLPEEARTPIFGVSARLVEQKGIGLLLSGHVLWTAEAQFVFLGCGERLYEAAVSELAAAAPHRIAAELTFTDPLEHELLSGADALLMPSLYEPCGLTQMRAQRYGTLPVARRVGGLRDTIVDGETGFLFDEYTPASLERAVRRSVALYADQQAWQERMRDAMSRDFGWAASAAKYLEVYRRARAVRAVTG